MLEVLVYGGAFWFFIIVAVYVLTAIIKRSNDK